MAAAGRSASRKPQIESKPEADGFNVYGAKDVFKVAGGGSEITAKGAALNLGFAAGNGSMFASPDLKGIFGTNDAIKATDGGKLNLDRAVVNAGAFADNGYGDEDNVVRWNYGLLFQRLMTFLIGAILRFLGLNNQTPKGMQ